jgi:hypothetical protein
MNLFFILLLLPLKLTSGYHDDDLFAGNRYYGDDEEYWSDDYDFYNDFSGDGEFFQTVSVENLRRDLFTNYSKNIRPVINYDDAVELRYGIEIVSLDYFDQKAESIELNLNMIFRWTDEYLSWNLFEYGIDYISVDKSEIWTPDVEMYNAGSQPVDYDSRGAMKLYFTGDVIWVRPIRYQFSCKLDLRRFPYDTQTCTMLFGSWKFSKEFFNLEPFSELAEFSNISVSEDFYHNEWAIANISCTHTDIEYLCCPGQLWPNSEFSITLERSYHKYLVVMIMSFVLILTGLTVALMSVKFYRRFYILVFVPLTIIWLQVYIADKIPIVEYSTTLEQYLVMCFTVTMLCTFESGIIYNLINWGDPKVSNYIKANFKYIEYFDLIFRGSVIFSFIVTSIIYLSNST